MRNNIIRVFLLIVICCFAAGCSQKSEESDIPDGAQTEVTQQYAQQVTFQYDRIILVEENETFTLFDGAVDPEQVIWGSADESVARFEDGVVTAVSGGVTTVFCEYRGVRTQCTVVCNIAYTTDPRKPVLEAPTSQTVEDSFFDDALFVGDSVSRALENARELKKAQFLIDDAYSVTSPLEDAIAESGAKKVFLMLGLNDLQAYDLNTLMLHWEALIARIQEKCPDIQIYIQSVTPVWTGAETGFVNNIHINSCNEKLAALAQKYGCGYIDIAAYLKDSTGGLATVYCADNFVHLTDLGVQTWIKVLKTFL